MVKKNNLIFKNIHKSFVRQGGATLDLLDDINFEFEPGKTYAITGVSGSGKSTMLHMLAGLEKPTKGSILFGKQNIDKFSKVEMDNYLNKSIGLVFQDPFLIRELTVWQNIALKSFVMNEASKARAEELLKTVGLEDKLEEYPNSLSGGQLQRVAILRALYNEPKFLLADEPTGNLDDKHGQELVEFILECKKRYGLGLIISTHDSSVAKKMDSVLKLQNGKLSII